MPTSVGTIEKTVLTTDRQIAPRYRVLLHNDEFNGMEYVVECLVQTVPALTAPQAIDIMMQAHNSGKGLVIICELEHAEFYCETLCSKGLTSTIEPDD
ncbi:MAG: ATP-dependent Clp protease adapter ClpS [Phormidesmis priestleyi]|uniref:ATP-dependent Clp protease adapter ClpS n=1 Tax=Phormidesmis priestleyi TaxID=268141 RepID=A0A2W4XQQ1_9CYAN|nr:MAG: ATP-dependent Clp protease adapter ClpS [Phormidesmis priestleyi]